MNLNINYECMCNLPVHIISKIFYKKAYVKYNIYESCVKCDYIVRMNSILKDSIIPLPLLKVFTSRRKVLFGNNLLFFLLSESLVGL